MSDTSAEIIEILYRMRRETQQNLAELKMAINGLTVGIDEAADFLAEIAEESAKSPSCITQDARAGLATVKLTLSSFEDDTNAMLAELDAAIAGAEKRLETFDRSSHSV